MRLAVRLLLLACLLFQGGTRASWAGPGCCDDDVRAQDVASEPSLCCGSDSESGGPCAAAPEDEADPPGRATDCAAGCEGACTVCGCCALSPTAHPDVPTPCCFPPASERVAGAADPSPIAALAGEILHVPRRPRV